MEHLHYACQWKKEKAHFLCFQTNLHIFILGPVEEKKTGFYHVHTFPSLIMGGTFETTAGFQDSENFQKAIEIISSCILSVISHLSRFKLEPGPTHA